MTEVTGLRNNALPYPIYGVPFGITFPILDADGDLVTGATGLDSEVSLNGDTFEDCTNEATEIATNSGMYYLLMTSAQMTADVVCVIVKTSSIGAKTTVLTLYPRKLVSLRAGTAQGGAAGYITLDASAGSKDDVWNGCVVVATIDSNVEARVISDYTGSSQQAAVVPDWDVTPDSDDTFILYLPEGRQINEANITAINSIIADGNETPDVNVVQISGDSTAADNLEAACDGTGFNIGGGSVVAASVTGAVGSVTGNVGGNVTGSVASVAGAVGSVTGSVGGNVTGTVGSLATQAKADVNAEVLDVLSTDTFAELASIPAATSSLKDKLTWMFMWFRNRVEQTATTKILKADNGSTTVATFTESDDGTTYTSGEGV